MLKMDKLEDPASKADQTGIAASLYGGAKFAALVDCGHADRRELLTAQVGRHRHLAGAPRALDQPAGHQQPRR